MKIIVNEAKEVIDTPSEDLEKVLYSRKTTSQKIFEWDSKQMKFIEKGSSRELPFFNELTFLFYTVL